MKKTLNRHKKKKVLKVYIVLEFNDKTKSMHIIDVYFKRQSALIRKQREDQFNHTFPHLSHHIIKKSIKDSHPLQFLLKYYHIDILNQFFDEY